LNALSPDLAFRVARLVPMLSSPVSGEVTATASAIERTLKSGGADWHDLAAALAGGQVTKPLKHPGPMLFPKIDLLTRDRIIAWMSAIAAQPWTTQWEAAFCMSIADQVYQQPHRTFSQKQIKACNGLLRRAFSEGIRP